MFRMLELRDYDGGLLASNSKGDIQPNLEKIRTRSFFA